jgi:hypothetical protein
MEEAVKHDARHPLPISNGWSGGTRDGQELHPTTWCGRCKGNFEVDDDWIDRYLEMKRGRLLYQTQQPRPYGLTTEEASDILAGYERQLTPWKNGLPPKLSPQLEPGSTVADGKCMTAVVVSDAEVAAARSQPDWPWNWRITCPGCGRPNVQVNTYSVARYNEGDLYTLRKHPAGITNTWADAAGRQRCGRPTAAGAACRAVVTDAFREIGTCKKHATQEELDAHSDRSDRSVLS